MHTIIEQARLGKVSYQMKKVAETEGIDEGVVCRRVAEGTNVILQRGDRFVGIGRGLSTKINVNIGTSTNRVRLEDEISKARIAEQFGGDTLSDLSMGGNIDAIRAVLMKNTTLPVTTVPIYQAVVEKSLREMTNEDIIRTFRNQAEQGVSSCVIHGVNRTLLRMFQKTKRILGVVSKGGSITSAYMLINGCENPFIDHFDMVLDICKKHDIVLSLGNTARSGCIHDRRDKVQGEEIRQNVVLADEAHEKGVQVIIEGAGGHIRADRIAPLVRYYKRRSPYPLFVAGPLPTDTAMGYDHIAGCVGASIASMAGADYLCYITPAEHLGLPDPESVKEGLIAFMIAAHIVDTVKYGQDEADKAVALMRASLDRDGQIRSSLDPARAAELSDGNEKCTMCGDFCAIQLMKDWIH
jgi:phosphomethylpyrimidine synthase